MPAKATESVWPIEARILMGMLSFALVGILLYSARAILIPIALSVLLTFLLTPIVLRTQRLGVPRIFAILLVAVVTGMLLLGMLWLVISQMASFASDLPQYRQNIMAKVEQLSELGKGGVLTQFQTLIEDVTTQLEGAPPTEGDGGRGTDEESPVPVRVDEGQETWLSGFLMTVLSSVGEVLGTAGVVLILTIFFLIKREDLRNRFVSLTGPTHLALTMKALDDAGQRISRYLLMQFIINGTFGLAVGVGLFLLGVPYAILWGLSAGVLRYIPYIGPWVSAVLPVLVSVITSANWTEPLLVIGLFVVLELISNNVMEPLLYGHSVGISMVALIISAVFWAWLWGPVGLVLSAPLSVCLLVAGKYVPGLSFLERLLGEAPAMDPRAAYYQRLLAKDFEEADELFEDYVEEHSLAEACDEILIPALGAAKRDLLQGKLDSEQEEVIYEMTDDLFEESEEFHWPKHQGEKAVAERGLSPLPDRWLIYGFPAHDELDEVALKVLDHLLSPEQCRFEVLSKKMLLAEMISLMRENQPVAVCICGVPPGGLRQTRQLCKKLRTVFPDLKILVGYWGVAKMRDRARNSLQVSGATYLSTTLRETQQQIQSLLQLERLTPHEQDEIAEEKRAGVASKDSETGRLAESLREALLLFDRKKADELFREAATRLTLDSVAVELVQRLLVQIGEDWENGFVSVEQEHFATNFFRSQLLDLMEHFPEPRADAPKAIAACAPDEQHEVGLLLLTLFLRRRGWNVLYLGQSVPGERLPEIIRNVEPTLVLFSATLPENARKLGQVATWVREQEPGAPLFVFGGQAFVLDHSLQDIVPGPVVSGDVPQAINSIEHLVFRTTVG